jgi:hypothetical protein
MAIDGGLRPLFRANLPQFDWTSVESGTTGGGIPDSNYCHGGTEGWIEYKQTAGYVITLRPEQVGWIARRVRHGGRVWVAVRQLAPAGPRREARDALWLVPGRLAVEARTGGLRPLDGAPGVPTWHHGPRAWDWRAVAAVLVA